jgi:Skp family chaperone for outer membrane proteins
MTKQTAIQILKDIEDSLNSENWQEETTRTIQQYEKDLKIATNKKIQKLIEKHKEYLEKYGEENKKTLRINKKVDKKIRHIFNN